MIRITLAALVAMLALGGLTAGDLALGQNAAPGSRPEAATDKDAKPGPPTYRYRFSHSAEGVLRLDNETGEVVLCRPLNGGWVCNPAPQETAVLQVELKRKDDEVKALTADFARLKDELARLKQAADRKPLQDELARLQTANDSLKTALTSLEKQVAEAGRQGITQDERRDMVSRLALLEQDNGGLKGALARLERDNAALKKQLAEAPTPPDLEPAVTQAIAANDALKRDLAAANDKIAALEKQVADDSARRALNAAVAQAREANEALKRELAATRDQLAALQKQLPADRSAQQAEIGRLKDENKALTDKLAALEMNNALMQSEIDALKPPPPPLPQAEVPSDKKDELKLPSREDLERARAALTETWNRLMEMIGQMQKDMLGGRGDPPVRL